MPNSDALHLLDHPGIEGDDLSLQKTDEIFGALESDIRSVVNELGAINRTKTVPRYCFDFDVLHPAHGSFFDKDKVETEESFWTSLALDLPGFDSIILPGTLFEIINYLNNRIYTVNTRNKTAIAGAFLRTFSSVDFNEQAFDDRYHSALRQLQSTNISDPELYLFSLLKGRFIRIDGSLPSLDMDIFYDAIHFLSRGSRLDRVLNNRVDAYNYSMVCSLNRPDTASPFRYSLVSKSDVMSHLDIDLSKRGLAFSGEMQSLSHTSVGTNGLHKFVCTPRKAAIMQLLWVAGGGVTEATRIAWELLSSITFYRSDLAATLAGKNRKHHFSEISDMKSHNLFVRMISSFESIQRAFTTARRRKTDEIELMRRTFDIKDPVSFLGLIKDSIEDILKSGGYSYSINNNLPSASINMNIYKKEKDDRFKYLERIDIVPDVRRASGLACSYFKYKGYHLFAVPGIGVVEEFLACFNVLRQSVGEKITAGTLPYDDKESFILTIGTNNGFEEGNCDDVGNKLSVVNVSRYFKVAAREINFVRIDAKVISASFEGRLSAVSSPYPLVDEFAFFVREMTSIPYRAGNFRTAVSNVVQGQTLG